MTTRLIFRCQFCDCAPDPLTQLSLERSVVDITFGTYVDAMPGQWLIWHGHGPYGPTRYACAAHRGDLVGYLREHYGTIGPHPWKRPPYPTKLTHSDRRPRPVELGERSAMPRWNKSSEASP